MRSAPCSDGKPCGVAWHRQAKVVLLIDGAAGLENMGLINFKDAIQIVDFYHAMEHAGIVLVALLGSKTHPDYKRRRGEWAKRLAQEWGAKA